MKMLDKSLQALTAEDLMTSTVWTIPAGMSIRGAARMLSRAGVSGAPVVDEAGRCVGVLSTTDFLHLAEHEARPEPCTAQVEYDWQMPDMEAMPDECVRSVMTANPATVQRDIPLGELAHRMLDAHIHRLIVEDGDGRPVGIVSTTDILAAVVRCTTEVQA